MAFVAKSGEARCLLGSRKSPEVARVSVGGVGPGGGVLRIYLSQPTASCPEKGSAWMAECQDTLCREKSSMSSPVQCLDFCYPEFTHLKVKRPISTPSSKTSESNGAFPLKIRSF